MRLNRVIRTKATPQTNKVLLGEKDKQEAQKGGEAQSEHRNQN
jgi:hypothetical protein